MISLKNKRIVVTGGAGFLGSHTVKLLLNHGARSDNIIIPRRFSQDLRIRENCVALVEAADIILHLAATDGGIGYDSRYSGLVFYDNIMMGVELMEAARKERVSSFTTIGSSSSYPENAPLPLKEENFWNGYPDPDIAAYAIAKKILLTQSQAYRKQYGFHSSYLILANIYGPGDNFNQQHSHLVASLVRKICDAKFNRAQHITLWGSGNATRELLYVEDAARAIICAMEKHDSAEPLNIGSGQEIQIKELAEVIAEVVHYEGRIIWDRDKPEGSKRRVMDVSKAKREIGFDSKVELRSGIKNTIDWYLTKTSNRSKLTT